jgi:hypothetical protein
MKAKQTKRCKTKWGVYLGPACAFTVRCEKSEGHRGEHINGNPESWHSTFSKPSSQR